MPAYLSHSIMGNELYNKSCNDEKIFKNEVNHNSLKTYALGIDLSHFIKAPNGDIHSIKTQEFLLNLIRYIKENNLIENEEALAFLYGHISHYFFDTNAHPLIYYIEKGCEKVGQIGTHTMVEGFLDSYMAENILQEDYMKVKPSFFNQANLRNPEIVKLLQEVYGKTYNEHNAVSSYKNVIRVFTTLETCTKSGIITKPMLVKLASFERFLKINNLTREEIINKDKNTWRIPLTGEKHDESFMELYNRALEMTMYAITKVNGYLYDGKSLSSLTDLFPNISYDTGVDIDLGYTFTYTRNKVEYISTSKAMISNVIVEESKVWIEFEIEGKYFPVHYEFNTSLLGDLTRLMFLLERTKAKDITDLIGKSIRVIDTINPVNSLVAIGDNSKNKFVDLYGSEFPVREKRIYRKYR